MRNLEILAGKGPKEARDKPWLDVHVDVVELQLQFVGSYLQAPEGCAPTAYGDKCRGQCGPGRHGKSRSLWDTAALRALSGSPLALYQAAAVEAISSRKSFFAAAAEVKGEHHGQLCAAFRVTSNSNLLTPASAPTNEANVWTELWFEAAEVPGSEEDESAAEMQAAEQLAAEGEWHAAIA